MPEIQAFRALRYDLGHIGSLADVVAPPYDVISPQQRDELYKRHPCNVVRLISNRPEPGDDEANNAFIRAAKFLKTWRQQGVLFTEADPCIYVYYQQFEWEGQTFLRRGFMARMRLQKFGEGAVFPHEYTMSKPKMEQLMLLALCKANLSQVFALYPDPELETEKILDEAVAGRTPIEVRDDDGVIHRMWPVADVQFIAALSAKVGPKPVFIADGHHRYETACEYRDQLADSGELRPDHPANYVLTALVPMEDPGVLILPSHRLFHQFPVQTATQLAEKLQPYFTCRIAGQGAESTAEVWEDLVTGAGQNGIAIFTRGDSTWTLAEITPEGRQKLEEVSPDHQEPWRNLAVAKLHRLLLKSVLQTDEYPPADYVHSLPQVEAAAASGNYPAIALICPPAVRDVFNVSISGERLPPKSTYFYPKLLSGLVINPLE